MPKAKPLLRKKGSRVLVKTKVVLRHKRGILYSSHMPRFFVPNFFLSFLALVLMMPGVAWADITCDVGGENETPQQLEARLAQCQAEIKLQSTLVDQKSKQATSLQRDIAVLKSKIDKSKLEI